MDINTAINEIIFKYHIDQYYPHYRNMYEARRILRNVVQDIVDNGQQAVFVADDETEIELIKCMSKDYSGICFLSYDRSDTKLNQLEDIRRQDCGHVYLLSYYGAEHAERWFRMHHIKYEWVYDLFERGGVFLQRPFYALGKEDLYTLLVPNFEHVSRDGWTESFQCELYCQRSKYESADNHRTKSIALERCLFLTLYMRNFIEAEKYVTLLIRESGDAERFQGVWNEIQGLLDDIRVKIRGRNQKDIILYWLDAIPFGDENVMPYLQGILEKAVVFENAFTYVANTRPTLRAMFMGKKDIDDEAYKTPEITYVNSPVIQFLEGEGYGIRAFTGYFTDVFPQKYLSDYFYVDQYETISMKMWDMLSDMLREERKMLWIIHGMEPHPPGLNAKLNDSNYADAGERYRLVRQEVDEQLGFYDTMMNENAFHIYMSDHGQNAGTVHTNRKLRFHILFNVYHRTLKPKRIEGFFSLLDFGSVLRQIILEGRIREEEFVKEYVEIGYMDLYSYGGVNSVFRRKVPLSMACFGYKGIVDREYVYIHYRTGKEWLQRRDNLPVENPQLFYDFASDVCEPSLLPYYRKLAGGFPEGIKTDDKFKYSRCLYAVYHNILAHNHVSECARLLNQMLEKHAERCVALRMGGLHSKMLYACLSVENKKKIWGFVDNNQECICSSFGLPVVSPKQIIDLDRVGVQAVLLSSYDHLEALRAETASYPVNVKVLDIYDYFKSYGIPCDGNFWEIKITDEDFDVGFPF